MPAVAGQQIASAGRQSANQQERTTREEVRSNDPDARLWHAAMIDAGKEPPADIASATTRAAMATDRRAVRQAIEEYNAAIKQPALSDAYGDCAHAHRLGRFEDASPDSRA